MTGLGYVVSPLIALALAPLFVGIVNRTKAVIAGRKGPPLVQAYFDILRLLRKGTVYSTTTSWVFRVAPVIIFSCTLAAAAFVPVLPSAPVLSFRGDFIVLVYLLGLARFFLVLSALDTGSAFEGMGSSREVFFSALAEPVALLCFLNVMRSHGAESLVDALSAPMVSDSIAVILAALPLFVVLLAENARIPFDDPNTHLELTMIHEVMILDNSGPDLALLECAAAVKLWLFALVISRILLPVPASSPLWQMTALFGIMAAMAVAVGMIESVMARVRLSRVPNLILGAGVLALLGFFISATGALKW